MDTKEAFAALIAERGVYKKLGVTPEAVKNWRNRLKAGVLTEATMEEVLGNAGWTVKKVIEWYPPKNAAS